jgi:hypothetical protein
MEPECPLPCSEEPATGPYPEPDESSPHTPSSFSKIILTLPTFQVFLVAPPLQVFLPELRVQSSHMRTTCPANLIYFGFIISVLIGKEYKLLRSLLSSVLQLPVRFELCSQLPLLEHPQWPYFHSHPHQTTGMILFHLALQPNSGLGRLHETFRLTQA